MSSETEYPLHCPVCGDDADFSTPSSGTGSIFQCFLKLFHASWRGKTFPFCGECKSKLILISNLQRDLKELEKRLKEHETELQSKLEGSETKFKNQMLYARDERYFKLRRQILGEKVSQPSQQPFEVEYIMVEVEDPISDNSPAPDFDDSDNDSTSRQSTERKSQRKRGGRITVDSEDDNDEELVEFTEDYKEIIHDRDSPSPSKSRPSAERKSKRKSRTRMTIDSDSASEDDNNKKLVDFKKDPLEIIHDRVSPSKSPPVAERKSKRKKRGLITIDSASEDDDDDDDEFLPDEDELSDGGNKKRVKISLYDRRQEVFQTMVTYHKCRLYRLAGDNYKCSQCAAILPNRKNVLRNHVVKNHTLLHSCPECLKGFNGRSNLQRHMDGCHNNNPRHFCTVCARPFTRAEYVRSHLWTHYSEEDKAEALARGEKTPTNFGEKCFQCDQCDRSYINLALLKKHLKTMHGGEKAKELCGICGAEVASLRSHMAVKHTAQEDRRFECGVCKKRFTYNHHLQVHRKQAHSTEKNFKCEICGKDFKFLTNLKEHQLSHEDNKPFECHVCGMGFTRKAVMNRHITNIHEGKVRSDSKKKKPPKVTPEHPVLDIKLF